MRKLIWIITALCAGNTFATITPAGVFTDHTVLQQGEPVRIWGTADPDEKVTVIFSGQKKETIADEAGKWMVTLDPMKASSEPQKLIFLSLTDNQRLEIQDVVIGEVWLAGGQSNMQTTMASYRKTTQPDMDNANDPLLRMVTIPNKFYEEHNSTARPRWAKTTPQTVPSFSASAYYFAKNLRETLGVPVGIVACSVGGTPAESWMSRETLESREDLKRIIDAYDTYCEKNITDLDAYIQKHQEYEKKLNEWGQKRAKGNAGPRPAEPMGPRFKNRPCSLFNNMLTQTIPYTIKGVIWYQGENNANQQNSFFYRTVFSELIKEWRTDFQNKNLPFFFVQLATYGPATDNGGFWPELRESQSWVEDNLKNTGMIVLTDGGEEKNIHPHSKDKVGRRLALLARNMVYDEKDLVCHGPRLKKAKAKGGKITLTFTDTGSGLVLKPEAHSAFEICGKDGEYVPATAELIDEKIIVSAENVADPEYVRYGWKKWFVPTLFNKEGLPASPFRTDDFEPETKGRFYLDNL